MIQEPTCCVCGQSGYRILWPARLPPTIEASLFSYQGDKRYHARIVECGNCGHRYANPVPAHASALYRQVVDEFYLATEAARQKTFADFLALKETVVPQRGRLLDVGCSTGIFLSQAMAKGYQAEGIELSSWAADVARSRGCQVRQMGIEDLAGDSGTYDVITAFDILEHLENPREAARTLRSRLNRGGCLVAVSPDMGSWHARILGENHWLVIMMHDHYFTRENFRRMLLAAGFPRMQVLRSPAYRLSIEQARTWAQGTALAPVFRVLSRIPGIKRIELRLRAGLYAIAFND